MTDFFSALELELHAAGTRRARRTVTVGQALGALAAAALLAVAVLVGVAVSGGGDPDTARITGGAPEPDPVGTHIPKNETVYGEGALVVANGTAPVNGSWQIEVSRTNGERDTSGAWMWHRGYCLWLHLLDPPGPRGQMRSGHCGSPRSLGFRKTPGFSRAQSVAPEKPLPREVLVWGRVPDRADKVVITAPGRRPIAVVPTDGPKTFPGRFYAIPVKPPRQGARINWLDESGHPGSRGIRLMPPITRH
jgi:hypothetical protein